MKLQPWAAMTAAFAAGSLAAVGLASASAPQKIPDSTTGVITACMVKKTGAVRFINAQAGKTCKKKEKKVTFNQTGPQGEQGAPGAPGAPGENGERGPSSALVNTRTTVKQLDEAAVFPQNNNLVGLTLQPGSYVISAHTYAKATNASTLSITCSLNGPTGAVTATNSRASVTDGSDQAFALTGTYSSTASGSVVLACVPRDNLLLTEDGAGEAGAATITATKIAELTEQ